MGENISLNTGSFYIRSKDYTSGPFKAVGPVDLSLSDGECVGCGEPMSFDSSRSFEGSMDLKIMSYFWLAMMLGQQVSNNARKRHHVPMRRKSTLARWGGRYENYI